MDGWKTTFLLGRPIFRDKLVVWWVFAFVLDGFFWSIQSPRALKMQSECNSASQPCTFFVRWSHAENPPCLHPWKLTWNLRMHPWKRRNIFQTFILRFHISPGGCILFVVNPIHVLSTFPASCKYFQDTSILELQIGWDGPVGWTTFPKKWVNI